MGAIRIADGTITSQPEFTGRQAGQRLSQSVVGQVGLGAAGIGIANTIPQIFGAAGRIPPGGPSLSAVFTALTMAFVLSPLFVPLARWCFRIRTAEWKAPAEESTV